MNTHRREARAALVLVVSVCLLAGCGSAAGRPTSNARFDAVGSVEQVYVTGLAPKAKASLMTPAGRVLYAKDADSLGGLLFRDVPPASGYRVRLASGGAESGPLTVHDERAWPWDPQIYHQSVPDSGYSYLTTRDGTKLAVDVHSPNTASPWPTLIEYSGYGYADPAGPQSGIAELANLMGFAVVDVNMRGTGCSAGAFDFFEPLQSLDGYDVIETVAHQPWVLDHKVGMMGISYGAISQLFVAQLDPPALEAIAPLSTLDAMATTLYPGGVLNTGFAVAWADQRQADAEPAGPDSGQSWAYQRIEDGDVFCAANQVLHGEAADLGAKIAANDHYDPAVADPLDPVTFVNKIDVPVFMACQWEDEQTGGHCADLVQHFTGTKLKWFTFTNGAHIDSLDPYTYDSWYDFLELFVAHQAPMANDALTRAAAPLIFQEAMGIPSMTLPPDPIQDIGSYKVALSTFEKIPEVRILFDNGAGTSPTGNQTPGDPYPAFQQYFSTLPVPGTQAATWYLGPNGSLTVQPPTSQEIDQYTSDPDALPLTDFGSDTGAGGLWGNASDWSWNWEPDPPGTAVSYLTSPLSTNITVIGAGAVDLWVRSSAPDVDLQATISEVRPDGNETFVQNGWIRADDRRLSTGTHNLLKQMSTELDPIPSFTSADAAAMPSGQFVKVVIPLYYEGHVYRAGSRIRVTISAPNGTQPVWSFSQTEPSKGTSTVSVLLSASMSSALVLPVVPGVNVPTGLPPCPSLRNEPCRPYVPIVNQTVAG